MYSVEGPHDDYFEYQTDDGDHPQITWPLLSNIMLRHKQ